MKKHECILPQNKSQYHTTFYARSFENFELKNWRVAKTPLVPNLLALWLRSPEPYLESLYAKQCLFVQTDARPKSFDMYPALSYKYYSCQQALICFCSLLWLYLQKKLQRTQLPLIKVNHFWGRSFRGGYLWHILWQKYVDQNLSF